MSERSYNSNIASEYYVISCLTRLGCDVNLTLGNKKKVDIVVTHLDGRYSTIDVKAVAGKMDWLIGNTRPSNDTNHFYVLVTYNAKFNNLKIIPQTFIIPASKMNPTLLKLAGNDKTRYVSRKYLFENGNEWLENWNQLARNPNEL